MTGDETGRQFVYDAWNRLVEVLDDQDVTLKTYEYDGLNRRVSEDDGTAVSDLYYSAMWQVLEERVDGDTSSRYVWSPVYVDAMVLRDRDTDDNGSLDERLWVMHDANFNVVALVDGSGTVVERFAYDPFGVATVLDNGYSVKTSGSDYEWVYLHLGLQLDKHRCWRYEYVSICRQSTSGKP
jgi:YD repeat-containing protein